MKKLLILSFRLLPFPAHFDFFVKLSALLGSAGDALQEAIATLKPDFEAWLVKENTIMQWVRKSVLTERIAEADRQIDRLLTGINAVVQAALHSSQPAVMEAARKVQIMLKRYGRVTRESYDEEAGDVRAILEQFNGAYAAEVTLLGLTNWKIELAETFSDFEYLLRQRETEQGVKPPYTARNVRKGIEEVYRQIAEIIDANCIAGTSPDFAAVIDLLNPDIERLNAEFARVRKDLGKSDHTVIEPLDTLPYTGKPITPLPVAYYREEGKPTVELIFGQDYSVTYKNNLQVGMAELIIHGKGKYKGSKSATFNIRRT
jgi:hypothetical protein